MGTKGLQYLRSKKVLCTTLLVLLTSAATMANSHLVDAQTAPTGAINGVFSVSATQQVYFSKGNLQYQASTNTWRFAENQYDFVGLSNNNISPTYSGWIDLFGWGTSGYDHGAIAYQPWSTSIVESNYNAYGNANYNLFDQTGKADWGYNSISNGGNQTNQWRILTKEEWNYVFNMRSTSSGIRFAKATVEDVRGMILLPDQWSSSTYALNSTNNISAGYNANIISASDWNNVLQNAGAVFLPAAGSRFDKTVSGYSTPTNTYSKGYYWSSTHEDIDGAYIVYFFKSGMYPNYTSYRYTGKSVRLVHSLPTTAPTVQSTHFVEGWTWWSLYVEEEGGTCLMQLEQGLGENGQVIKTQTSSLTYIDGSWYGTLDTLDNTSSYRIKTNAEVDVDITGQPVATASHPVTLNPNWTWIGYPCTTAMSLEDALASLTPMENDVIKSQSNSAIFMSGDWYGDLETLEPGMGLLYKSGRDEDATLVFPSGGAKRGDLKPNLTAESNHWQPNLGAYPDNMTVVAVVEFDEEPKVPEPVEGPTQELGETYELAVFANGECRGSVRLLYVEPIQRYIAFLTVAGNEATELRFGLYNRQTGEEYLDAEETVTYQTNAVVGTPKAPFVVHFRSNTSVDEWGRLVNVYPNPVSRGQQVSIGISTNDNGEVRVETVNALGAVISSETATKLSATIKAPSVPGVYTLCIFIEGQGTCYRRLIVE